MKSAILCEGKTDAVLTSYMLGKLYGWKFNSKLTQKPTVVLPALPENESLNWYSREKQELVIWGVGGQNELPNKLKALIERTRSEGTAELRFSSIAIIFDRDDKTDSICLNEVKKWLQDADVTQAKNAEIDKWLDCDIKLLRIPAASHSIKILAMILPPEEHGALESFLLSALKGSSADEKDLVEKAEGFIAGFSEKPYFTKKRLRPKATLGSVLSVMSPDWIFSKLDARLQHVPWENLIQMQKRWDLLKDI